MMYECEMLLKCIFVWENKSLTNVGESLNPGLQLKSMCVFKLCLECFHRGFLFCCLRRILLGNIEKSVESVDSCLGEKFRILGCPLLYWGVEFELMSGWVQASQ